MLVKDEYELNSKRFLFFKLFLLSSLKRLVIHKYIIRLSVLENVSGAHCIINFSNSRYPAYSFQKSFSYCKIKIRQKNQHFFFRIYQLCYINGTCLSYFSKNLNLSQWQMNIGHINNLILQSTPCLKNILRAKIFSKKTFVFVLNSNSLVCIILQDNQLLQYEVIGFHILHLLLEVLWTIVNYDIPVLNEIKKCFGFQENISMNFSSMYFVFLSFEFVSLPTPPIFFLRVGDIFFLNMSLLHPLFFVSVCVWMSELKPFFWFCLVLYMNVCPLYWLLHQYMYQYRFSNQNYGYKCRHSNIKNFWSYCMRS